MSSRTLTLALALLFASTTETQASVIIITDQVNPSFSFASQTLGIGSANITTNGNSSSPNLLESPTVINTQGNDFASAGSSAAITLSPLMGPGPQSIVVALSVSASSNVAGFVATANSQASGTFQLDIPYDYMLSGSNSSGMGTFSIDSVGGLGSSGTLPAGTYNFTSSISGSINQSGSFNNQLDFTLALTPASNNSDPSPVVPEPASCALFGGMVLAASGWGWRRRRLAA